MEESIKIQLMEINRLISYDRSKTLLEQPESFMDRKLGITNKNTKELGMDVEEYESKVFGIGDLDPENWTVHGVLETAELVTGVLGVLPFPPLVLVANLASMGFGLANAGLYAYEGEYYDASIALAFAMIPGPETITILKKIKNVDGITTVGGKPVLNSKGKEVIEQGVLKNWKKALGESLELYAKENGLEKTLKYVLGVTRILNTPIRVYLSIIGFPIAVDTLYYLFTLAMTEDNKLTAQQQRQKSQFKPVIDLLKSPKEQIKLAIYLAGWFLSFLSKEDVESLGDIDESMFENIKPDLTDEQTKRDIERLIRKYSEETD